MEDPSADKRLVEHMLPTARLSQQQGMDANAISYNGDTALYRACVRQQLEVVQMLLEAGADVNAHSSGGETALYRASKAGHEHIVRVLLEAGAETIGSIHSRPLYAACEHGHMQVVKLLLQHGADPNASSTFSNRRRPNYRSAFLPRRISADCHEARVESLPICCAVQKGYTDIVNLLLQHGADINKRAPSGKSVFMTVFELMISRRSKATQDSNPSE